MKTGRKNTGLLNMLPHSGVIIMVTTTAQTIFELTLGRKLKEDQDAASMAESVTSGRKKIAEVRILAHGGKAVSRRTKRVANKALRRLEQ